MIPTERSIERRHSSSDCRGYRHLLHLRASGSVSDPQLGHFRVSAIAGHSILTGSIIHPSAPGHERRAPLMRALTTDLENR